MRSKAFADHLADGCPVALNHREHAIGIYDHDPRAQHDEPADVTVSDLLDLGARERVPEAFYSRYERATREVRDQYAHVLRAIKAIRDLSPEERAEFDRRTT